MNSATKSLFSLVTGTCMSVVSDAFLGLSLFISSGKYRQLICGFETFSFSTKLIIFSAQVCPRKMVWLIVKIFYCQLQG